MKILFHIEPHGMRDGHLEFTSVLHRMLPLLAAISTRPGHEARLLCNPVLADLILQERPDLWPLVLQPDALERREMQRRSIAWDTDGMDLWTDLMRDPGAPITAFYIDLLRRLGREEFGFDAMITWGENAALRHVATASGIPRLHLELASFRAPFIDALLIDPEGTNGGASTVALDLDALTARMKPLSPRDLLALVYPGDPPVLAQPQVGRRRVALIPLQLSDDANLLLYSPYPHPGDLLTAAAEPLLAAGWQIRIKPHPGAILRGAEVWRTQERVLNDWRGRLGVEILADDDQGTLVEQISQADLVVGNNSSVLFEATFVGRMSIPLGDACFAPPGAHPDLHAVIDRFDDAGWRRHWMDRARLLATYLLATAFVPADAVAGALMRRLMTSHDPSPGTTKAKIDPLAWADWPGTEDLRTRTLLLDPEPRE